MANHKLTSEFFESVGITVSQPKEGHRYGAESLALANFAHSKKNDQVVELGSGCGVVSLVIAVRDKPASVTAVEIQKNLHDVAAYNVVKNGLSEVITCVNEDYRNFAVENGGMFNVVVSNPPFFRKGEGNISSTLGRATARHELNGTIEDLVIAANLLLIPGGKFFLVFPEERRIELMKIASLKGFELYRTIGGTDIGPNFLAELDKK